MEPPRHRAFFVLWRLAEYTHKEGSADIGGTVRARFRFVAAAAVISIILFLIFGGTGSAIDPAEAAALLAQYQRPFGLLLLIPTLIVILMAIRGGINHA